MAVATCGATKAQEAGSPHLGLRLGLDIDCPSDMSNHGFSVDMFDAGVGFHVGGVYNIPLWRQLYFEPGIDVYYNTFGCNDLETMIDFETVEATCSVRRFGFRIPLVVGWRWDFAGVGGERFHRSRTQRRAGGAV